MDRNQGWPRPAGARGERPDYYRPVIERYERLYGEELLLGGFNLDRAVDAFVEEFETYHCGPDEFDQRSFDRREIVKCVVAGLHAAIAESDQIIAAASQ
jgi:hypothetical protein